MCGLGDSILPGISNLSTSKSGTKVSLPPPTATQTAIDQLTLEQLQRQGDLMKQLGPEFAKQLQLALNDQAKYQRINDRSQQLQAGVTGPPLTAVEEAQAQQAYQQFQRTQQAQGMQDQIQQMQLDALKNGGKATPEQAALIDEATGAAQASGESDISRWLQQTQRQIDEETAQAAGLRPTDSPVMANVSRAAEEATRQQGQLTLGLQSANANAKLNYPLAAQQVQTAGAASANSLNLAGQQFQAQLAQTAQNNRMSLMQQPFMNSLNFGSTLNPSQYAGVLAGQRIAGASTSSFNTPSFLTSAGQVMNLAGGVGGMIGAFSDRRLKSNIVRIGTHRLGIGIYEFDMFGKRQAGVMADEVLMVMPQAVTLDGTGFYRVKYAMLE